MERPEAKRAEFETISKGVVTWISDGKLYFHVMKALVQFESDLIAKHQHRQWPGRGGGYQVIPSC